MVVPDQDLMCVIESNTLWIMEYSITCVLCQIRLWELHQLWIVASITTESIRGRAFGWTFNLVAFLPEWNLNCTSEYQTLQQQIIDLTAIQMVSDHQTMPNWESNWANLISRGIGCKVFNHLASGPDRGGLGGATLQRSPTRIVRKVKSSSWWPRWQMMYNEKFWRYCQRSSPTKKADKYFFGWN